MEERINQLISEAEENFNEKIESFIPDEIDEKIGLLESSSLTEPKNTTELLHSRGLIFLGNFLKGRVRFTITGKKNGIAKKEIHDLNGKTSKWLYNWDTGSDEILIIHSSYRNNTATYAPFYGCAYVWYQNCR